MPKYIFLKQLKEKRVFSYNHVGNMAFLRPKKVPTGVVARIHFENVKVF
jgi:hypothetical protein